jgi:hypothetical protein
MEYSLNGRVSLEDYIQFNKAHQKHGFKKILRPMIYIALCIFLFYTLIPEMDSFKELFRTDPYSIIKIFMPLIIIIIAIIIFNTIGMKLIYKKHYNSNKLLQQMQTVKINEQCICIISENGNVNFTKENINKIIYDMDSIYIYTALNIGYILKKRFLENENDFEELVQYIKKNYEKK